MLKPGPGMVFVNPDERHKVRASGLLMPTIAQDDPFHGTVIAVGDGAWYGHLEGFPGLVCELAVDDPRQARFTPVERRMPVAVGDTVVYEPEAVQTFAIGFGANTPVYYALHVRDLLATAVPA